MVHGGFIALVSIESIFYQGSWIVDGMREGCGMGWHMG